LARTLVTGATGFIGKHLVKALVKEGREVRCLVRKKSNTKDMVKLGVELCYGDLLSKQSLEGAIDGVDFIHHIAGEVYSKRVTDYYNTNVVGTKNLIEVCYNKNIKKFMYLSSIAAVGQNANRDNLLNEKSPCNPMTPYGKSKFIAEKMVLESFYTNRIPVVIIRPPIVYGPGQPYILTRFFRMIEKGDFKIIGDGNNLKSFCYIDNLIQGILLAENSEKSVGKIYFISDNQIYTPKMIAQAIANEEGVAISQKHLPFLVSSFCGLLFLLLVKVFRVYSISLYSIKTMTVNFGCDISRSKEELGYNPSIDLEEGVKRTLHWCREEGLLN